MTCRRVVGCLRKDAESARSRAFRSWGKTQEPGAWRDLLSAECPNCKARVFVMPAEQLKKVIEG